MDKILKQYTEDIYKEFIKKPLEVLDIFNDFFGSERVDMQDLVDLDKFTEVFIKDFEISNYFSRELIDDICCDDKKVKYLPIKSINESTIIKLIDASGIQSIVNKLYNLKSIELTAKGICMPKILIHFPCVRLTNEYDKFTDIYDLWAKVILSYNGTLNGGFTLNRSNYSLSHFINNFMHSHVSSIPIDNFQSFRTPCLGTGPIRGTITSLNRAFYVDLWNLFCLELSKYVCVESVSGTPYHRLESLAYSFAEFNAKFKVVFCKYYLRPSLETTIINSFITYFINLKVLKFNFINGSYSIGISYIDYIILISNEFIKWYNDNYNKNNVNLSFEKLKEFGILKECIIKNNRIYKNRSHCCSINDYSQYIGKKVCTFKGKDITINITNLDKNEYTTIILNLQIALYIATQIIKVLNYKYGKETTDKSNTKVKYL